MIEREKRQELFERDSLRVLALLIENPPASKVHLVRAAKAKFPLIRKG